MTSRFELGPVERITAGAVGPAGSRTFYLQASEAGRVVSLVLEKGQVAALARYIEALLDRLATTHPATADEPEPQAAELALAEPIEPAFRIGSMSLGYDAERDLVLLECAELVAEDEDEEEDEDEPDDTLGASEPTGAVARFWASRAQMRALARHGSESVAAGRPTCQLCGAPIDPEGHVCIALNGHRKDHDLS